MLTTEELAENLATIRDLEAEREGLWQTIKVAQARLPQLELELETATKRDHAHFAEVARAEAAEARERERLAQAERDRLAEEAKQPPPEPTKEEIRARLSESVESTEAMLIHLKQQLEDLDKG